MIYLVLPLKLPPAIAYSRLAVATVCDLMLAFINVGLHTSHALTDIFVERVGEKRKTTKYEAGAGAHRHVRVITVNKTRIFW